MIIDQERIFSDNESSFSLVFVDGVFECFFIEDEPRDIKVPRETRIPAGVYDIRVRDYGNFHERYQDKFPEMHQGMLEVCAVPGFSDILIHCGNYESNTEGCLLPNTGVYAVEGNITGQASVVAYKKLYRKVIEAALDNNLSINIIDRDL